MKKITIFAFALLLGFAQTAQADLDDVIDATCQIVVADGYDEEGKPEWYVGSGVVYRQDKEHYYVLTAAHCVLSKLNDKTVLKPWLAFYHSGRRSNYILAEVIWSNLTEYTTDLAVLKFAKKDLGEYPPPHVLPVARKNTKVKENDVVYSCGCPAGNWPSLFRGRVNYCNGNALVITPNIIGGRSGSAVVDAEGKHILGIIVWKSGDAVPLRKIYRLTQWEKEVSFAK